ncbi:MAG TPA: protein kinase [Planctomycetota bacterium]|nr:protein kinase [Planctomycetota bacterium]
MAGENRCPQCGAALGAGGQLRGLCPACLLKQGAADSQAPSQPAAAEALSIDEMSRLFPQLEMLCQIGKGGMGVVYKARQKQLDRMVALKILPPGVSHDASFAERFAREAKALAKLQHPNIVTLYEFGETQGQYYFLMEYVDGLNLRQLLNTGGIAPKEALAIVPQICDALQFAHDHDIVHRDIKPENILLNKSGEVKIADFGVAKIVVGDKTETVAMDAGGIQPSQTDAGKVVGTPQYMAPEQFASPGDVDNRADIYALGVVFYQMLTGELPAGKFERPSRKVQIDVRLDEVVLRALEKEPSLRFQQVSEMKTQVVSIAQTPSPSTQPEAAAAQTFVPRFSRMAIFGAAWVALFFAVVPAFVGHELATSEFWRHGPFASLLMFVLSFGIILPAFLAPFGATILGWIAVSKIRRSQGRLYGLWLAVFDGLALPLVGLYITIGWMIVCFGIGFLGWPDLYDPARSNAVALLATMLWGGASFFIVRNVWRAANAGVGENIASAKPFAKRLALGAVVMAVLMFIAMYSLYQARSSSPAMPQALPAEVAPLVHVTGTVEDAVTGAPIARAQVTSIVSERGENRSVQVFLTDDSGRFDFTADDEARTLKISAENHSDNEIAFAGESLLRSGPITIKLQPLARAERADANAAEKNQIPVDDSIPVLATPVFKGDLKIYSDYIGSVRPSQTPATIPPTRQIEFSIPQNDVQSVVTKLNAKERMPVEARDAQDKSMGEGALISVASQIDTATGTLACKANIEPRPGVILLTNMFVTVRMLVDTKHGVVLLPTKAILSNEAGRFVYLVNPGRTVSVRHVTCGKIDAAADCVEVTSGLAIGEIVVLDAPQNLHDGSRVTVTLAQAPTVEKSPADDVRREVYKSALEQAKAEAIRVEAAAKAGLTGLDDAQAAKDKVAVLEAELTGDAKRVIEAKLRAAHDHFNRVNQLHNAGVATALDFEKAKSEVVVLEAQLTGDAVRVAQAKLEAAKNQASLISNLYKAGLETLGNLEKAKAELGAAEEELLAAKVSAGLKKR